MDATRPQYTPFDLWMFKFVGASVVNADKLRLFGKLEINE